MTQEILRSVDLDASQQPINGYIYPIIAAERQDGEEEVEYSAEASRTSNNDLEVFKKPRFEWIAIKELEPNPLQLRINLDLDDLFSSIIKIGPINPICVAEYQDGQFYIIDGHRRVEAYKKAGEKYIQAVVTPLPMQDMIFQGLVANIERKDLEPLEIAQALAYLKQNFGLTHDALARRLGNGKTWVTEHLQLMKLPASIQDGLSEERIPFKSAVQLARLAEFPREQELLYEKARKHSLPVLEAKILVNLVLNEIWSSMSEFLQEAVLKDPSVTSQHAWLILRPDVFKEEFSDELNGNKLNLTREEVEKVIKKVQKQKLSFDDTLKEIEQIILRRKEKEKEEECIAEDLHRSIRQFKRKAERVTTERLAAAHTNCLEDLIKELEGFPNEVERLRKIAQAALK